MSITGGAEVEVLLLFGELTLGKLIRLFKGGAIEAGVALGECLGDRLMSRSLY